MINLEGIFPPLPTPFDDNENLAPARMQENIIALSRYDLAGFLVLGSNGEAVHLSYSEKVKCFEAAREAIPKGKLMLAGTGCNSTRETIELTQAAATAGSDAVLVLNPSYYKGAMTREALKSHFHTVADASEIPVIIYNMPANTGIDMSADDIAAIAGHDNIVGLKDSGGNVTKMGALKNITPPGFQILAGSAGFLLPALTMGAVGGILASANIAPEKCIALHRCFKEGDMERALAIQLNLIPVNNAVTQLWGVPALKAAMDHLGLYGGSSRKPLLPLTPDIIGKLLALLEKHSIDKI